MGGADSGVTAAPGGGSGGAAPGGGSGGSRGGGGEGKAPLFSVRAGNYRRASTLNICDAELVGTVVEDDGPPGGGGGGGGGGNNGKGSPARRLPIKASYYGGATVGRDEAARMLSEARIANIAGRRAVGLAVSMGLGAEGGVKTIGGVPFLIVFR